MAHITHKVNKFIIEANEFKSGIDLAHIVAKRAETLLLGNGYETKLIKGKKADQLKFNDEMNNQNLIGILSDVERNLSKNGEQAVIVDYDGNGDLRLTLPEQTSRYYTTTSGKLVGAWTQRKITWGTMTYLVRETWDINEGSKVTIVNNDGAVIPIPGFNAMVTPELQVDNWDFSSLKRIPIILFQNLNSIGNKSEPDGLAVKILQSTMDHALYSLYKEVEMSRARYAIDASNEQLVKNITQYGLFNEIQDSVLITDQDYDDNGKMQPPISVLANELRGDAYQSVITFYQDKYLDGCGYSPITDSMAQETVVGTLFTNKKDMETTRKKLKIREAQLEDFSNLICDMLGLTSQVVVKLKVNILFDEQVKLEYMRAGVELGVLTEDKKIGLYYGISDQKEINTIKKQLEKEDKDDMEKMKQMDLPNKDGEEPNKENEEEKDKKLNEPN